MKQLKDIIKHPSLISPKGRRMLIMLILLLPFGKVGMGYAQDDDGYIVMKFDVRTHTEKAAVEGADITIYADNTVLQKLKTDKKGHVNAELKYGPNYRIAFYKTGFVKCFLLLNSEITLREQTTISTFAQSVLLMDKNQTDVDTVRYKHPFTKWSYNKGSKWFEEDVDYLKVFASGIFKEDELAKEKAAKDAAKQLVDKQAKEKAEKDKDAALKQKYAAMRAEYKKQKKFAGKIVSGGKTPKPVVGAKISLLNANNEPIATTTSNALGNFVFIRKDASSTINIEVGGVNAKYLIDGKEIVLANKDGQKIKSSLVDSKGKFNYRFLAAEEKVITEMVVDDADLKMDVQGQLLKSSENAKTSETQNSPLANIILKYVDDLGNVIVTIKTDAQGKFQFKSLANDAFYLFSIDDKDAQLKAGEKIVLADSKGNVIKEIQRGGKGDFNFEIISSDQNGLATLYYDDPWLKVIDPSRADKNQKGELIIKEKVYFNSNDATLLPEAKRVLDEVVYVMENATDIIIELSSHSDSKGSDEYNLTLSKKRAKAAVDYIISQGVSASRITGIGYGETKLINKCGNGVECTEDEHAENRRLEFKVKRQLPPINK
ncbi:MAG TPA: OmpA family protein [Bacteroidia bacterium]